MSRHYKMSLWEDSGFETYIEMTEDEAQIIARVLRELEQKAGIEGDGYCGMCCIDIENYIST